MSPDRNGNFTSSQIYRLMTNGKSKDSWGTPAFSYIEECNMERRLGRALENELDAKATSWGKLVEKRAFDILGLEYVLCSDVTISHPEIKFWKGSPDATVKARQSVADIKCPLTLKSYCQMVDPYYENGKLVHDGLSIEAVRMNHKDGDKFFWQIVSNAILTGSTVGELIVYVPYKSEIETIKDMASSAGEGGEYTKWIYFANDGQLPYLIDGGHYKNVNVIKFDILDRDKEALKARVLACGEHLIEVK